ncbi:MAG: hypothetical protein KDK70_30210 [Myxococcales bacterium]|nr:hypothetical protein [Myxococcales bacterium]
MLRPCSIPPASLRRLPIALALAAVSAPGCTVEGEPALGEREVALADPSPERPIAIPGAGSVCGQERAPALLVVDPAAAEQLVAPGQTLRLELENHHASSGVATIDVDVHHERGGQTFPSIHEVTLLGGVGRTTVVELPVGALGLPTAPLALSGQLVVTARVDYDDGTDTVVDGATRLFFHPADGGWRIYDEATRTERYRGGALDDDMQRWAAEHPGARFGPAWIEKVADDTSWRPTTDGLDGAEPEPEHAHGDAPASADHLALAPGSAALPSAAGELAVGAGPAAFTTVKFCFEQKSLFTDAGHGEDYWTSNTNTARSVAGTRITIYRNGSPSTQWLGDGIGDDDPGKGCTTSFAPAATFTFRAYARAMVQGNEIDVESVQSESTVFDLPQSIYVGGAGGTYDVTYDPGSDLFNVMAAASQGLYRHAGGLSGKTFDIRVHADDSYASTNYAGNSALIYIEDGDEAKKFIITHELGHTVGGQATGGRLVGNDCSFDSISCPSSGSHSMTSKEYSNCAIGEGFAHFYAADIWNDHYENSCVFEYWGSGTPAIDCEGSSASYPSAYMESACDPTYDGRGVELDWLRQFWDVHTEGSDPSMNQMLAWMDGATAWGTTNGYDRLDAAANAYGGAINSNWDGNKGANGVDH